MLSLKSKKTKKTKSDSSSDHSSTSLSSTDSTSLSTDSDSGSDDEDKSKAKVISTKKVKVKVNAKTKAKEKTILYLNDDATMPVSAGGVLIYKNVNNAMHLLLIDSRNVYEDIGGKIDETDEDIYNAIAREVEEETNNIIEKDKIIDRIKKAHKLSQWVYVPKSKYVIFLVEATPTEQKLEKEKFGDTELHDNFPRTIGWISRENLMKPEITKFKMNWRMKSSTLFEKLKGIESNFKFNNSMFKK